MKKKYGKKPITSTVGSDIAESLKADPALTAFSFDGPYPVRDMADLLDNLYCMDNGRYYETPVDFYGLAKAPRQSAWHESALYFKRNVLTGCFIPHKLLNRQTFSAFALDWFTFGNADAAFCGAHHLKTCAFQRLSDVLTGFHLPGRGQGQ